MKITLIEDLDFTAIDLSRGALKLNQSGFAKLRLASGLRCEVYVRPKHGRDYVFIALEDYDDA